jgi:hypothetical protein
MKNLYIVKNITSGEVNSPMVYRKDAILGADTWSLIKTEKEEPTGEVVSLLTYDEFCATLDSVVFGGTNGVKFRKEELRFCEEVATAFAQAQSALSIIDGNDLFDVIANTSHRISRGQSSLAWLEFNAIIDPLVTVQMRQFVNAMFDEHFVRVPRDLT